MIKNLFSKALLSMFMDKSARENLENKKIIKNTLKASPQALASDAPMVLIQRLSEDFLSIQLIRIFSNKPDGLFRYFKINCKIEK